MSDILRPGVDLIRTYVNEEKMPGACCAFVYGDQTEFDCVGYRSLTGHREPVTLDTVYDLASVTKVVSTTTVALQAIEKGMISLNTPVADILPDFPHPEVTIRHILTHTSGICHDDKRYRPLSGSDQIWEFIKNKPLEFSPGEKVVYSDFGYVTLGFLLQRLLGPLDQYAEQQIFCPLGMMETVYNPAEHGLTDRCAPTERTAERGTICGVVHDGKAYRLKGISGNAGLFSTVKDLSIYAKMILGGGQYHGVRILSEDTIHLLQRSYTDGLNQRRTLGWFFSEPTAAMGDYYSDCVIFHTGFTGTSFYIDYIRKCAIILLTNRINPSRENPYIAGLRNKFHNLVLLNYDRVISGKE
jgi:CubicO group peptidase (beta-lactamase class C family)